MIIFGRMNLWSLVVELSYHPIIYYEISYDKFAYNLQVNILKCAKIFMYMCLSTANKMYFKEAIVIDCTMKHR